MRVKRFFSKPYRFGAVYAALLAAAFTFVLLDAFVIPRAYGDVAYAPPGRNVESQSAGGNAPNAGLGDGAATEPAPALAPGAVAAGSSSGAASAKGVAGLSPDTESEGGADGSSAGTSAAAMAVVSSELYPGTGLGDGSPGLYPGVGADGASLEQNAGAGAGAGAAVSSLEPNPGTGAAGSSTGPKSAATVTDTSYDDGNISINIETTRIYETTVHIADIKIKDASYLKTALANNQFGRNIDATTSEIARAHNAIFAINGDYYGFRDAGCVLRNGVLYRSGGKGEALAMDSSGNLYLAMEEELSAEVLGSAWQVWSFGPALVSGGEIAVGPNSEISGRSANSNPRTALGQVEPLHYVAIVSEGRTSGNEGLSLYQLAEVFAQRGCPIAYNLDGGGSSTMVLGGRLVNSPTTNGRRISEREVSDIVYIGYE